MRLEDIPDYLQWLTYVSYFRHAFQAEMLSLYGGNRPKLNCSEDFSQDAGTISKNLGSSDKSGTSGHPM